MDELLHGHNPDTHIVAANLAADNFVRLYIRSCDRTESSDVEFFPFFFLSSPALIEGFPAKHWIKELTGGNFFRYLCAFERWSDMWEAVRHVLDRYNASSEKKAVNYADLPVIHLRPDPIAQFLLQSGRTLFIGMRFEDLHRMQLDIETSWKPVPGTSRASHAGDHIIMVSLSDNRGWEQVIDTRKMTEARLLEELAGIIREKDPDVIEGHNIYSFDLPIILGRCEQLGVEFRIGRDGDVPRAAEGKAKTAESGDAYEISGRHVIDTLVLLKAYDAVKRRLESHSLKYAAQFFGFARPDRVYIPGNQIWWYWEHDPDKLARYALDDVYETRRLADLLSPSVFYLTRLVPLSYGTVARSGSSVKIESLLLREYVRQKRSVPRPQTGLQVQGGYTDLFHTGVFGPIVYADVESLYPSIMVQESISPRTDELGVFPLLLKHLTGMRLDAKKRMSAASSDSERSELDALQSSYKGLINSFYGYLGYPRGLFNDHSRADAVAARGQEILKSLITEILSGGGKVVEVDTDGIFFVPPSGTESAEAEEAFLRQAAAKLPPGIRIAIDGRFRKMFSYKKKNYAQMGYDGKVYIKGSSLISRSIERFGRRYIEECITCILNGDVGELHDTYVRYRTMISNHGMKVHDLARSELLRDSREKYEREVTEGRRNRSASYEAAIGAGLEWKRGNPVTYYITGKNADVAEFKNCKLVEQWDPNFPDENIAHYLRRLEEFSGKFEEFFIPKDFRAVFSLDGLFDFSPKGIAILTNAVTAERDEKGESKEDLDHFPIWLDLESGEP